MFGLLTAAVEFVCFRSQNPLLRPVVLSTLLPQNSRIFTVCARHVSSPAILKNLGVQSFDLLGPPVKFVLVNFRNLLIRLVVLGLLIPRYYWVFNVCTRQDAHILFCINLSKSHADKVCPWGGGKPRGGNLPRS